MKLHTCGNIFNGIEYRDLRAPHTVSFGTFAICRSILFSISGFETSVELVYYL
jgi:hypothetical protein